jgi:hypothetical protein
VARADFVAEESADAPISPLEGAPRGDLTQASPAPARPSPAGTPGEARARTGQRNSSEHTAKKSRALGGNVAPPKDPTCSCWADKRT